MLKAETANKRSPWFRSVALCPDCGRACEVRVPRDPNAPDFDVACPDHGAFRVPRMFRVPRLDRMTPEGFA